MQLTRPVQLSSVPEIDSGALAAVNGSFDTLERLLGNVHALAFGQGALSFTNTATSGTITLSNVRDLRLSSGQYLTPAVLTGCGLVGVDVSVTAVGAGTASFVGWTASGALLTATVPFWYLLIA